MLQFCHHRINYKTKNPLHFSKTLVINPGLNLFLLALHKVPYYEKVITTAGTGLRIYKAHCVPHQQLSNMLPADMDLDK